MSAGKCLNESASNHGPPPPAASILMCLGWGDTKCIRHFGEETTWKTKEEIGG